MTDGDTDPISRLKKDAILEPGAPAVTRAVQLSHFTDVVVNPERILSDV